MMQAFPITLAIDIETVVVWGLIVAGVFGSWIINVVQKAAEYREAQRKRERGLASSVGASSDAAPPGGQGRDLAAQRRDLLREQVRQRAQVRSPASTGPGSEPGNMTMAERIARARAKQQYAQRSAQLRERSASGGARPVASDQARREALRRARQQAEHEARQRSQRESAEVRRRQLAQRQAEVQARSHASAHGRQRPAAQVGPQQRASASRPAAQPVAPLRRVSTTVDVDRLGRIERLAGRVSPATIGRSSASRTPASATTSMKPISQWSTRSLRQALIMKEVLDRPVALRDPIAEGLL